MPDEQARPERGTFLNFAAIFEGSLVAVAFALGWLAEIDPMALIIPSLDGIVRGLAATIPMFLVFLLSFHFPLGPFRAVRNFLVDVLGPYLDLCRWYDLVLLALLAGVCEEILFRGTLQPWFSQLAMSAGATESAATIGMVATNLVFGFAHWITPAYGMTAAVMGAYLSGTRDLFGPSNLLAPIVTHSLYDLLAFFVVIHAYRTRNTA